MTNKVVASKFPNIIKMFPDCLSNLSQSKPNYILIITGGVDCLYTVAEAIINDKQMKLVSYQPITIYADNTTSVLTILYHMSMDHPLSVNIRENFAPFEMLRIYPVVTITSLMVLLLTTLQVTSYLI